MIWRIVSRYAELSGNAPTCSSAMAYATFDGLFQQALLRHLAGSAIALDDLRSQSLFEESFRADVADIDESLERMIWRIVSRYAELSGNAPTCSSAMAYATFDGLFQQALLRHLAGSAIALDDLRAGARHLLSHVVCA
jgi:hypothetical protein